MAEPHAGLPLVALVGRPNVGKSTFFNRLSKERIAIVESLPGVTRDRLHATVSWNGRDFLLVDTGGITDSRDSLAQQVTNQAMLAAAEADVVLFLVDARDGLLPMDQEIAGHLRRIGRPVILVVNKAEHLKGAEAEFYRLGLGEAFPISAEHGLGINDVLDRMVAAFPETNKAEPEPGLCVAVVGRPNVGKSSLVNALLGVERVITSDVPGTTRDAIDTRLDMGGEMVTLIDTAGIRRAARFGEPVEYYSVLRAIRAVERSDLVLLILAADDLGTLQDRRIAGIIRQAGKAAVIAVNKWDLRASLPGGTQEEYGRKIREIFDFLDFAPIVYISARTGAGLDKLVPAILEAAAEYERRIPTARLNEVLNEAVLVHEPPSHKGRKLKLFYASQVRTKPPVLVLHVNDPDLVHFSYQRYLENRFREAFGLRGTPIILRFKKRTRRNE